MRLRTAMYAFSMLIFLPLSANGHDSSYDYARSQALFAAVNACKSDGCDLRDYRFFVRERKGEIEVVFLGRSADSAEALFSGKYENVLERHFFFDGTGTRLLRRGYGK